MRFSHPQDDEAFLHRSGRTGRAGNTGTAVVLFTERDARSLGMILKATKVENAELIGGQDPADVVRQASKNVLIKLDKVRELRCIQKENKRCFVALMNLRCITTRINWCSVCGTDAVSSAPCASQDAARCQSSNVVRLTFLVSALAPRSTSRDLQECGCQVTLTDRTTASRPYTAHQRVH